MITSEDFRLANQSIVDVQIELTVKNDDGTVVDRLYGVLNGGSIKIDSGSSVRRTASFSLTPTKQITNISEQSLVWLNKNVTVRLGILDQRTQQRVWYNQGVYLYQSASSSFDVSNNSMSIELSDWVLKLDGTVNGQVGGAITVVYQAYDENPITGEPIQFTSIKKAVEDTLKSAGISPENYEVQDIGEYYAMPQYNDDWEHYRNKYPLWNMIPYDQEFSTGCSVWEILTTLVELYPNYDAAFDANGKFIVKMIPSEYTDAYDFLYDDYFDMVISEEISTELTGIKNICEVWGESMDTDWYKDGVVHTTTDNYKVELEGYPTNGYVTGTRIAVKFDEPSVSGQLMQINNLPPLSIYNQITQYDIGDNELDTSHIHVFYITRMKTENDNYVQAFLYLGVSQAHGIDVLTDGTVIPNGYQDPTTLEYFDLYSKEYYEHVLNCDNVSLTINPDSPFTVQKLGNRIDVKADGEFNNITSNELALERAQYENWKNSRLTDNVTITTKLMPFVEPYMKIDYKKQGYKERNDYIVQSVSHDLDNGTTTITMYTFYPLYKRQPGDTDRMTYKYMSGFLNKDLAGDEDEQ